MPVVWHRLFAVSTSAFTTSCPQVPALHPHFGQLPGILLGLCHSSPCLCAVLAALPSFCLLAEKQQASQEGRSLWPRGRCLCRCAVCVPWLCAEAVVLGRAMWVRWVAALTCTDESPFLSWNCGALGDIIVSLGLHLVIQPRSVNIVKIETKSQRGA